ncbi:MAG: polyribonucleotide nucleotidyltransferase, partial [Bryobacteraceae bacterium]|nr:polyribonucleotide nucleotidyltransferase [Bryobacteraceae bacterium]
MSGSVKRHVSVAKTIGDKTITLESGKLAKQATGAVTIRLGDTISLVTTVVAPGREGLDFFPLTVDYREKSYAAGKFPGGFIKREGRPSTKEILTARLIDRPIRPLFPASFREEVQIQAAPLSADRQNDPDVISITGASASLVIAEGVPFLGPVGASRLARIDGALIPFPTDKELRE